MPTREVGREKNFNQKTNKMKKIIRILPILWIGLAGTGLLSCSHNKCDEMFVGKLIVLEKPYEWQNWCDRKYHKIVAHLVVDEVSNRDTSSVYHSYFKICGSIPKEYNMPGEYNVSASLKPFHPCFHNQEASVPTGADPNGEWYFYKLSCVNKIQ